MIAGLPKSVRWLLVAASLVVFCSGLAFAQTIDPPPIEEQTSSDVLQPLLDAVGLNATATDAEKAALVDAFSVALSSGQLTLDQALAMLALASWDTLSDPEAVAGALAAMDGVLQGLADGSVTGDPLAALAAALAAAATPAGIRNAISRAGGSEELLAQVDELVSAGVPPGILVRLTKQSFHDGVDEEGIALLLDEFAAAADGDAWGRVANDALDVGANTHRDREENANRNAGDGDEQEQEEETNRHGSGGSGKKA